MTISPSDAAVAARSFPRRWKALFARAAGDDEQADVLERSGAVGLADEAAALLATTAERLPVKPVQRPTGGGDAVARLESASAALAETIGHVPADDWGRGGAIELLQAGIDGAAALLRQAEAAVERALAER